MKLYKFINYKFLRSHKVFLTILIIIIVGFLFYNPIIEGFTSKIGEYEFLAPPTDIISDDMWNKLTEKMKKQNPNITIDQVKLNFKDNITPKEIKFYLENNTFPISPYIKKMMKNFNEKNYKLYPSMAKITDEETDNTIKNFSSSYTTRMLYDMYNRESGEDKQSPQPESYLIYKGTKPSPSYSSPTISINKSTMSLTESIPSLNEIENKRNYNDLVSLCKRVHST
jgi:hypothetical protein